MHPLEAYLLDCHARRGTGAVTPETSLYGPLEVLLTAAGRGKDVKPRVTCFMSLKNQGGNMPDGGLFTPDQIKKGSDEPPPGQIPSRGVIECKKPKDALLAVADSDQVSRYWDKYEQVLVTNYREFVLLGRDGAGNRVRYEHFVLADSEKGFWSADPAKLAKEIGNPFLDFLKRCLLRPAPVSEPRDVAWFLASYAREAKNRVERAAGLPGLNAIRTAMEQALGVSFEDPEDPHKGIRFFRSTLVQTLFYGVFSAWVLWHRAGPKMKERFDWEKSAKYLLVPVVRKLFHELNEPGRLSEWKLDEVLGWAGDVLNRVDRGRFFEKFHDAEAVQYFYEPFLEQFDPDLRKQLGVWYTPPEIVRYMVARVDQVLKTELGRPDGLADESVYVLDPCCGTGAYLVEVLRHIDTVLKDGEADATRAAKLKRAATTRVFGFELLPAPFVIAHLQLGLMLKEAGAGLGGTERVGVYLTNALTGWETPKGPKQLVMFDEFQKERELADEVKRNKPLLVVLGNPPYNGFAGVMIGEERDLVDAYRWHKGDPPDLKPQGQGLNDLYVRFYRMAERCIVGSGNGEGVVSFISNYSWLDGLSFPLMRDRFLKEFDAVWIDSLNGDKYRTGKRTPDGNPDPSAFTTSRNREGIQPGTAVSTLVRKKEHATPAAVRYRDFWGVEKLKELEAFGNKWSTKKYTKVTPKKKLALPFRPMTTEANFTLWPEIPDLFPIYFTGVKTSRDDMVVDVDKTVLVERMSAYFDKKISHAEMSRICPRVMDDATRFEAVPTRERLQRRGFLPDNIVPFAYRPFDTRWLYWEPETKLLDEKRDEYFPHIFKGNSWFSVVQQNRKDYDPPPFHPRLASLHIIERGANVFPMLLRRTTNGNGLFGEETGRICHELGDYCVNSSDEALAYLSTRGGVKATPHLFFHTIAQLHAPAYSAENSDALRQDWPRVPLPSEAKLLRSSAALGRQVAALLDSESPVEGITTSKHRSDLKVLGLPTKVGGGQFDPAAGEWNVAARWGIAGKNGVCMPGPGKAVERAYTPDERKALGAAGVAALGETTFDVYLNEKAYWKNVPSLVWSYTLGGYQVVKKWLSYREYALLGRGLKLDEVEHVRDVARRIAAIRLLGPALDANYASVKADLFPWPPADPIPD